jgi:hypothetical protein
LRDNLHHLAVTQWAQQDLNLQPEQIDVWTAALAVGQPMPILPLVLNAEICLPIDLEATYTDACRRRRLRDD